MKLKNLAKGVAVGVGFLLLAGIITNMTPTDRLGQDGTLQRDTIVCTSYPMLMRLERAMSERDVRTVQSLESSGECSVTGREFAVTVVDQHEGRIGMTLNETEDGLEVWAKPVAVSF